MAGLDDYTYELIDNENDARVCAQLLAEEFAAHNPIVIYDQLTSQRVFNEDTLPLMMNLLNEHLSFLARYRPTGEIVSVVGAGDLYIAHQQHPYDPSSDPSSLKFLDLVDEMEDIFIHHDFGQALKLNMVLQIVIVATRSKHSGKGLNTQLSRVVCNHARETRGFQYAFVQTMNPATHHIYVNKMHGKELTVVDPTTWIWKKKGDGSYPYKDYRGGSVPNILIKLTSDESN